MHGDVDQTQRTKIPIFEAIPISYLTLKSSYNEESFDFDDVNDDG
jgi:hypothetical protein